MAYTPINWQTGDTITAAELNKMDNGWGIQSVQLFSETVTTASSGQFVSGRLTYSTLIDADTLEVAFNGTTYVCQRNILPDGYVYGGVSETGLDFTNYPFALLSNNLGNILFTETAGTYTISASASVLQTSDNFQLAVSNCVDIPEVPTVLSVDLIDGFTDKTWAEIEAVISNNGICLISGRMVLTVWQGSDSRLYMAVADNYSGKFDPYIWRTSGTSVDETLSKYKRNSEIT